MPTPGPAALQRVGELGQVGRVVLAVAVHGHHDCAPGGEYAGTDGRTLAGRAVVADMAQAAGGAREFGEHLRGAIGRAVVDDDHLIVAPGHRRMDLADQDGEVLGFVLARNDD